MTEEPPPPVRSRLVPRKRYEAFTQVCGELPRLAVRSGDWLYCIAYFAIRRFDFQFRTGDLVSFETQEWRVSIFGRNLQGLVDALRMHACSLVQEFDARDFAEVDPADGRAPFVERIDV